MMLSMTTEDHTGRRQRLRAETYEGLVEAMHATAFVREESAEAYMPLTPLTPVYSTAQTARKTLVLSSRRRTGRPGTRRS